MALSFRQIIADVSGGNYIPVTTGTYSLRVDPFSASTYAGTHVANGSWNFGTVADGVYQLWNEAGTPAQVVSFGEVQIIDSAISSIGITLPSNMDANSKKITNLATATTTGDAVPYEQVLRLADTQVITGQKSFNSAGSIVPYITAPTTTGLPTATGHFTSKYYVDSQIASIATSEFQESVRKVRVFPDGTEVTDQVYGTILKGVASFTTPTANNKCLVEIVGMGAASFITASVGSLKDYVTLKGSGKHIWVQFQDDAKTAIATLQDMTVIMGNEGSVYGARAYNSVTFENCIIYHYHNVTLTNCEVRNCLLLGSSSYAVTVDGSTKIVNSQFNNAVVDGGSFTGTKVGMIDTFTFAPPSDPTAP